MATTLHCMYPPSASLAERSVPVPHCPTVPLLQARLHELQAIERYLAVLGAGLRRDIDARRGAAMPIDLFTAAALIRLWRDVVQLEAQTRGLLQDSRRRLEQAAFGYQRLYREVNHG